MNRESQEQRVGGCSCLLLAENESLRLKFAPVAVLFSFSRVGIFLAFEPEREPVRSGFLRHHPVPGLHENVSPRRQVDEIDWLAQPLQSREPLPLSYNRRRLKRFDQ